MEKIVSHSPEDTAEAGRRLGLTLKSGDVVALTGGLGMGKTQFIRGIARGLGVTAPVTSPTFTLVHEYGGRVPLYHFDMYRIGSWDDLETTGFFDYLKAGGVCAIEWSENIWGALPPETVVVQLMPGENAHSRLITVERGLDNENSGR